MLAVEGAALDHGVTPGDVVEVEDGRDLRNDTSARINQNMQGSTREHLAFYLLKSHVHVLGGKIDAVRAKRLCVESHDNFVRRLRLSRREQQGNGYEDQERGHGDVVFCCMILCNERIM